jgi:iron complex outermembrane receptor protein
LFDISAGDHVSIFTTSQHHTAGIGIGGTLSVNNNLDLGQAQNIRSSNTIRAGSFGEKVIAMSNIYGVGGFRGATKLSLLSADNDFPFINDTRIGAPVMHQTNGATRQLSFTQQLQYTIRKNYTVGADLWITDADRQLPPVMTIDVSHEHQWDQSYRAIAYLSGHKERFRFSLKTAYLYDKLKYTDPSAGIDSRSSSVAIRNIFSATYEFRQNVFLFGELHYDHETARSTGFDITRQRDLASANLMVKYIHGSGLFVGSGVHGDLLGTHVLPVSASVFIGVNKYLGKGNLVATLNGDRSYRLPALNDLYWNEGGNPNLRPEKAWKSAIHVNYEYSYWLTLIADGYYNYVTDWILWHPTQTGIWMPDNVRRVLSRGTTIGLHLQSKKDMMDKGFIASGTISYSYTKTTSLDAVSANDNSQGKQLIYVPLHNFTANIRFQYRHFYILCAHSHTGERFTSTDNSQSLKAYYLTHLEAGKDFYLSGQQIGLSFRVSNIANMQYQAVADRPMPGRSFEGTVRINLVK